ncbi:MAG: zinc ABC transporter substrate-binding protein [Helicobacteraceae bacterium]|nr:zinc ABC transporter substrate-binding protein [Helicobacteraceae bacterium]
MNFFKIILVVFICVLPLSAKMIISVSVLPQAFFVKQIAGNLVDVNIMVPKGKSPETYEPSIKQLQELSKSSLYFNIGMPFEKAWLERFKAVNPNMKIIPPLEQSDFNAYLDTFSEHNKEGDRGDFLHNHNQDSTHNIYKHNSRDSVIKSKQDPMINTHKHNKLESNHINHAHEPHIWLSFILSKYHIKQIANSLIDLDSANADIYKQNLEKILQRIDVLYNESKKKLETKNKSFLVYHPAYSYIANELGLVEYSIERDGKEAKITHTKEILEIIKKHNIKTIFIQPQFSQKNALAIAKEAKLKVEMNDPLAYEWLDNLEKFIDLLANN